MLADLFDYNMTFYYPIHHKVNKLIRSLQKYFAHLTPNSYFNC